MPKSEVAKWPHIILESYSIGDIQHNMIYLSNLHAYRTCFSLLCNPDNNHDTAPAGSKLRETLCTRDLDMSPNRV